MSEKSSEVARKPAEHIDISNFEPIFDGLRLDRQSYNDVVSQIEVLDDQRILRVSRYSTPVSAGEAGRLNAKRQKPNAYHIAIAVPNYDAADFRVFTSV